MEFIHSHKKNIGLFLCMAILVMTFIKSLPAYADDISQHTITIHDIVGGEDKGSVVLTKTTGEYVTIQRPIHPSEGLVTDPSSWYLQGWYDDMSQTPLPEYQYKDTVDNGGQYMAVLGFYMPAGDIEISAEYTNVPWSGTLIKMLPGTEVQSQGISPEDGVLYQLPENATYSGDVYTHANNIWESSIANFEGHASAEKNVLARGEATIYATYTLSDAENTLTINGTAKGDIKDGRIVVYKYDETEKGEMPGYTMYFDGAGNTTANIKVYEKKIIGSDEHKYKCLIFRMPDKPLYIVFTNTTAQGGSSQSSGSGGGTSSVLRTSTPQAPVVMSQSDLEALDELNSGQKLPGEEFEKGKGELVYKEDDVEKIHFYIEDMQDNRDAITTIRDSLGSTTYFMKEDASESADGKEHLWMVYSENGKPSSLAAATTKVQLY